MNCYIFDVHINCCFTYENSEYNLVEFGPLNMINSQTLSIISAILQKISSDHVPKSWWIEFSTWRDFKALLRTGSMLSIHRVVKYMTENLENVHGFDVTIDTIDENGNIEIAITEETEDIFQGFIVKAKRKRLRRGGLNLGRDPVLALRRALLRVRTNKDRLTPHLRFASCKT